MPDTRQEVCYAVPEGNPGPGSPGAELVCKVLTAIGGLGTGGAVVRVFKLLC